MAMVVVGFALHLALFPVFLVSGLVVPWPAAAALLVVWVALFVAAVARRHHPPAVLAAPVLAAVIWVGVVSLGEWLFDWTA